jgi:LmbE family N-acetylglucosaminyl deacetylase
MKSISLLLTPLLATVLVSAQPDPPLEEWTGKKILHIGAHPDDDTYSQGTLAMLQDHGNEVWVVVLTDGSVGTQDPDLSRFELSQIRRLEEIAALGELGIPEDHYINLGYVDGLIEFGDQKEIVKQLVRLIRKIRPDLLLAFDPGKGAQRWHKSDHRAAAYLTADAARVAMWRLLFPEQIIHEGLQAHMVPEYLFYDGAKEDKNYWVDISAYAEKKINAMTKYVSQFHRPSWNEYKGPNLSPQELEELRERVSRRIDRRDGKAVEGFRHYRGFPDGIGR